MKKKLNVDLEIQIIESVIHRQNRLISLVTATEI